MPYKAKQARAVTFIHGRPKPLPPLQSHPRLPHIISGPDRLQTICVCAPCCLGLSVQFPYANAYGASPHHGVTMAGCMHLCWKLASKFGDGQTYTHASPNMVDILHCYTPSMN